MRTILFALLTGMTLVACRKEASETRQEENTRITNSSAEVEAKAVNECYAYAGKRDTVRLELVRQKDAVNGSLAYRYFEKDRNDGIVSGVVKGDTLVMVYEFMSEGLKSKRQVVFVKKDGGLVEGFGPVFEKDSTVFFKDLRKLQFPGKMVLMPVACE